MPIAETRTGDPLALALAIAMNTDRIRSTKEPLVCPGRGASNVPATRVLPTPPALSQVVFLIQKRQYLTCDPSIGDLALLNYRHQPDLRKPRFRLRIYNTKRFSNGTDSEEESGYCNSDHSTCLS